MDKAVFTSQNGGFISSAATIIAMAGLFLPLKMKASSACPYERETRRGCFYLSKWRLHQLRLRKKLKVMGCFHLSK